MASMVQCPLSRSLAAMVLATREKGEQELMGAIDRLSSGSLKERGGEATP